MPMLQLSKSIASDILAACLSARALTSILAAGLLLAAACSHGGGGTDTFGSGTDTDPGPGFTPDPVPCEIAPECFAAIDCCPLPQPGTAHVGSACPSSEWPNNWSCVSNVCVHGGCTSSTQCATPGFICAQVGGVGHCVAPCTDDSDCTDWGQAHGLLHTECIGEDDSSNGFCLQPLPLM